MSSLGPSLYSSSGSGYNTAPLQTQSPDEYDFYVSPSDKFNYETEFEKYSDDGRVVDFANLNELFAMSRLPQSEIITIWNVVDLMGTHRFNKEQFVYFLHIVHTRRRTSKIPTSLPLRIKEQILAAAEKKESRERGPYVRPRKNTATDTTEATVTTKSVLELESELSSLENTLKALKSETQSQVDTEKSLQTFVKELEELSSYKKKQVDALRAEVGAQNVNGNEQEVVEQLRKMKTSLIEFEQKVKKDMDAIRSELSR